MFSDSIFLTPTHFGIAGAMIRFRQSLALSFLFKAFLQISQESGICAFPEEYHSAFRGFHKGTIESSQLFEARDDDRVVGQTLKHLSGAKHATGEAVYVDDMPKFTNESYLGLVLSTRAHAEICGVDFSKVKVSSNLVPVAHKADKQFRRLWPSKV